MKVFILTTIPAPYRTDLFNVLGQYCDLHVCFEKKSASERNDNWYKSNAINFKIHTLNNWDKPSYIPRLDVNKLVDDISPDICIAYEYSTPTAMLFMKHCIHRNIKYVINCDGAFITHSFIKDKLKTYFISHAAACFANGVYAKNYFLHYGAKQQNIYFHNFSTLYKKDIFKNIITETEKTNLKSTLGFSDKKTIISIGQFIYRKGFDVLLKAFNGMDSNYNLVIIGGGEKHSNYIEYIKSNNLENVTLLDFMTFDKLIRYLRASDLFVLPTREDIWGLVINEAMACGLPIVTTNKCIAGLELIENGKNGFIVDTDSPSQLAYAINEILSDDVLCEQMGKNNLAKISPYTIENSAQNHFNNLQKILRSL